MGFQRLSHPPGVGGINLKVFTFFFLSFWAGKLLTAPVQHLKTDSFLINGKVGPAGKINILGGDS